MPKASDRRRAKDRIVEGIARAIKHIQSYQLSRSSEEHGIVLKNSDWQFHKLVENLDHAFLYGLRHFTRGYWVIVQEFTHRSTIEDIVKMSNVATDLGRGRAWLYLALSDRLLESYIHCFINNAELLRKHYVREALVLDEQRLELLLTLSSGLELIAFDLEVNVQYLDLCCCLKFRPENREEEIDDDVSLCSMISSQSQSSSSGETNWSRSVISPLTLLSSFMKPRSFKQSPSSASLTLGETEEEKKLRIETFANAETLVPVALPVDNSTAFDGVGGEVEVIRVRPKRVHARKRDHARKSPSVPESDDSSLVSADSSGCLLMSPTSLESSGYQTVQEDSGGTQRVGGSPSDLGSKPDSFGAAVIKKTHVEDVRLSEKSPHKMTRLLRGELVSEDDKLLRILDDHLPVAMPPGKVYLNSVLEWKDAADPSADRKNRLPLVRSLPIFDTADSRSASSPSKVPKQPRVNNRDEVKVEVGVEAGKRATEALLAAPVEEPSIYDKSQLTGPSRKDFEASSVSVATVCGVPPSKPDVLTSFADLSEAKRNLSKNPVPPNDCTAGQKMDLQNTQGDCFLKMDHSAEIMVDNNLKVVLMLDVFLHEEEVFFKMFQTCQGHTEGKIAATYVMITSHYLYFLRPSSLPNKFTREVAITYKELDYIAVSLNYQVLHIVCRVRHNQFWITTGDEVLTRIIISNLKYAVHKSSDGGSSGSSSSGPLMVLVDATAQKISIAKLVSEEMGISREEVSLLNYSLVHWEDSEAVRSGDLCLDLGHEGILFYKTYTATILFAAASWHQGYFVLEQGVLHQYSDKNCSGTPMRSISLGSGQCSGCRQCPASDRKYAFEILLSHGSDLELSASSEAELQEWLVRLDQATRDQSNPRTSTFGCVACCAVVTQSHVFMCHEDLQTNFLRSLGGLAFSSLSRIQTDESSPTCCVLVYEKPSGTSREADTWCVYFKSAFEREKFVGAISEACKRSKQAVVETVPIEAGMVKRCQAGIAKLSALHRMGVA